jgi:hypothetical protein
MTHATPLLCNLQPTHMFRLSSTLRATLILQSYQFGSPVGNPNLRTLNSVESARKQAFSPVRLAPS